MPETPLPETYPGRYNDGQRARTIAATARVAGGILLIEDAETGTIIADWPLTEVHLVGNPDDGQQARIRRLNAGDRFTFNSVYDLSELERACPNFRKVEYEGGKGPWRSVILWGGAAIASVVFLIFVGIPQLSGVIAENVPDEWAQRVGDAAAENLITLLARQEDKTDIEDLYCTGKEGHEALQRLAKRLAPEHTLKVDVVDVGIENAFAVPGGRLVILRGLIDKAEDRGIVAGVFAHEIGHEVHKHALKSVIQDAGTSFLIGLMVGDIFGGSLIAGAGQILLSLSFSREAEEEADAFSVNAMNRANLDARSMTRFFGRLSKKHGSAEQSLVYLSTHPVSDERKAFFARSATGTQPAFTDAEWKAIKGMCKK